MSGTDLEQKVIGAGGIPAKRPPKQLPPWAYEFAAWYARQPVKPTRAEQIEQVKMLSQRGFTIYRLRKLHANPEFQHALLTYTYNHLKRAEELVLRKLDKYVENVDWAIETAREEGDHIDTYKMSMGVLENTLWKKKEKESAGEAKVTINISQARLEGLDADIPEVEVEEITDGGEEEDYNY
jgi:hypothetical protein